MPSAPGHRCRTKETSGSASDGIPAGTSPASTTPAALKSKSPAAATPSTTTNRAPGARGRKCFIPTRIVRATAATRIVGGLADGMPSNIEKMFWKK